METLRAYSLPPGFGFHPTDVELISHYLRKKLLGRSIEFEVIPEVDIYKHEPWDLPEKCNIPTKDTKWHFFAARDRKYTNGSRLNRATEAGYWKSTGKDRNIKSHNRVIGTKKTLVFHTGRPPHGKRSDWIMHEYCMDEKECKATPNMKNIFVLCRVTKRNGLEPGGGMSTQSDGPDNCPKQFNDVNALMPKEESSSPSENIDDYEAWCTELYDPDFSAALVSEMMSEPKAVITALAAKQETTNSAFLPNISDDLDLLLSTDDIANILQSEHHGFNCDVFGGLDRTTGAASNYETNDDRALNEFLASLFVTEDTENYIGDNHATMVDSSIGNHAGSFMNGNDKKEEPLVVDAECVETGIQIRERSGKISTEIQKHRIRLQTNKLEKRNSGLARTVQIFNRDQYVGLAQHLNVDHISPTSDPSEPVGTEVEEKPFSEMSSSILNLSQSNKEIKESSDSENIASKVTQTLISDTSLRRRHAGPSTTESSSNTHRDDAGCVQGAIRGICMFLRGCSSIGLNCLFLMGTAALILYFLMRDARRFLNGSSPFGL